MADRTIARALVKTYGVDRDLPCPRCGYNLKGNTGGRCPECGKDVSTFLKKASLGAGRRRIVHLADVGDRVMAYVGPSFVIILGTGFWAAVRVSSAPILVDRVVAGAMILMALVSADVWRRHARRTWRRQGLGGFILRLLLAWAPGVAAAAAIIALVTS